MATIQGRAKISGTVTIELSEQEAAALDALVGYGSAQFLAAFYKHLGEAYLKPYEAGLLSLFDSVRAGPGSVSYFLRQLRESRKVFEGTHEAKQKVEK